MREFQEFVGCEQKKLLKHSPNTVSEYAQMSDSITGAIQGREELLHFSQRSREEEK